MIRLLLLLFGALSLLPGMVDGAAAGAAPHAVRFGGREYILLRDWAERGQFEMRWLKKDEELRLANRTANLSFKVNSQRAEVNGVTVFLSFPVLLEQGNAFIAAQDIDRSLGPLLRPPRNKPGSRIKTIALCAGHGGKDGGNQIGGDQEKTFTLLLAREVQKRLHEAGFKVVMVRDSDAFIDLEDRMRIAIRRRADLYISLHYNSAGNQMTDVHGSEVYCLTLPGAHSTNAGQNGYGLAEPGNRYDDKNMALAYQLQKALVRHLGMADRGVRRARFVVLRVAQMPAVLVEAGFMSNPEEMRRIKDPLHRRRVAQAIVEGVLVYKRAVES